MQAEALPIGVIEYVPATHWVHRLEPAGDQLPSAHMVQLRALAREYVPIVQVVHTEEPTSAAEPAAHAAHVATLTAIGFGEAVPAGQEVQEVLPGDEYTPDPQGEQVKYGAYIAGTE